MTRAAVTGAIDFAKADPFDKHWWRRLYWVMETIENEHRTRVLTLSQQHWSATRLINNLEPESYENARDQAHALLLRVMGCHYPWMRDELSRDSSHDERQDILDVYREEFGQPGDPKYDAMVKQWEAYAAMTSEQRAELSRSVRDEIPITPELAL